HIVVTSELRRLTVGGMTPAATIARLDVLPQVQLERLHVCVLGSRTRVVRNRRRGSNGVFSSGRTATRARCQHGSKRESGTEFHGAQEGFHDILPDHWSSPQSHRAATSANTFFSL